MTMNQILDDEDDVEKKLPEKVETDEDVIVEGDEDEERAAKTSNREDEEGLTEEQKREQRRVRKKRQKERARQARDHDKAMIAGLQNTLAELNAKMSRMEVKGADDDMAKVRTAKISAQKRVELLKAQIKNAADDGANDKLAELTDQLVTVRSDIKEIENYEHNLTESRKKAEEEEEGGSEKERRAAAQKKAQVVRHNVQVFSGQHDWYVGDNDPDAEDEDIEDSETVRRLDAQLTERGSDPSSSKHWQTLEALMKKKLPHRFEESKKRKTETDDEDDEEVETKRKNPSMTGGTSRSRGRSQDGEGYTISKQRKEAMMESGIWQDPARRKATIEAYKRFDKAEAK